MPSTPEIEDTIPETTTTPLVTGSLARFSYIAYKAQAEMTADVISSVKALKDFSK